MNPRWMWSRCPLRCQTGGTPALWGGHSSQGPLGRLRTEKGQEDQILISSHKYACFNRNVLFTPQKNSSAALNSTQINMHECCSISNGSLTTPNFICAPGFCLIHTFTARKICIYLFFHKICRLNDVSSRRTDLKTQ